MANRLLENIKAVEQQARRLPRVEKLFACLPRNTYYTDHFNELKRMCIWLREKGEQAPLALKPTAIFKDPIRTQEIAIRDLESELPEIRQVSQTIQQSHMEDDQISLTMNRKLPTNYKPMVMSGDQLHILQQAISECCKQTPRIRCIVLYKRIFQKYKELGGTVLTNLQQLSEKICYDVLYLVTLQQKKHGCLSSVDQFDKQS